MLEPESKSKLEYFLSLHQILIPSDKFNLNYFDENYCKINYFDTNMDVILEIQYNFNIDLNKISLSVLTNDIISSHIKRLLESKKMLFIKFDSNSISEYLFEFGELISKYFNYCTICASELNVRGIQTINSCDNLECVELSYQTAMDDKVINAYKQDSNVFLFLLDILIAGISHPRGEIAYKPIPRINGVKNLECLKNLIINEKEFLLKKNITKILEKCDNDIELINKTNPKVYSILKNAISNNYFSMSSRDNIELTNISNTTKTAKTAKTSKISISTTTLNTIKFIHINYSADIENKFKQNYFLFHGSNISSWYPIIKNGLKVMSGTAMMTNGAAFGNGIYFSDSFQMSYSYSLNRHIKNIINNDDNNNNDDKTYEVVGVFEVLEDPSKYKKTPGIYVIDNDKIILLRTLVLIKSGSTIPKDISNYFLKELPLQKQTNKLNICVLKNKRLEGEYKKLSTLNFIKKINIEDQTKWCVDFAPIKNFNPSIEFIFSNYPINPPIIKLLSTNTKITGLIDTNNNVNIDLINPSNWKITNNLSEIASILYKCFQESL